MRYVVEGWQFIEQRFTPRASFVSKAEAWDYVSEQIESGKDISRFRIVPVRAA